MLEWVRGTALRPVLAALPPAEAKAFEAEFAERLRVAYPATGYGTLLPFRRIFAVGAPRMTLRNWAGNVTFSTDVLHRPTTVEQVQELVAATPRAARPGQRPLLQPHRRHHRRTGVGARPRRRGRAVRRPRGVPGGPALRRGRAGARRARARAAQPRLAAAHLRRRRVRDRHARLGRRQRRARRAPCVRSSSWTDAANSSGSRRATRTSRARCLRSARSASSRGSRSRPSRATRCARTSGWTCRSTAT